MATTQDSFEALLTWLNGADREAAGQAYEVIRAGLLQVLISRGFSNAEDLADETIKRVTRRVPEIAPTYEGKPVKYFYGVLRNVIKEQLDVKEIATEEIPVRLIQPEKTSAAYDCLKKCLSLLPFEKSELILDYYAYRGKEKIRSHDAMAAERGISVNALRIQAYKIRTTLEACVHRCLTSPEIKLVTNPIERRISQ